ncbi:MAG: 30S ribosomal protein S1 [delta proteobacterium MLS_D]|jgi:small subunit ribosomal protein S1|nr:MAG: 30S ribosomal protein S1 [delta proteobacterium MLS_D]
MVNDDNVTTGHPEETPETENMLDEKKAAPDQSETMSFDELFEQSLQDISTGRMVTGRVVEITGESIMVDVGYKTEGRINAAEFKDENGVIACSVGDEIEVVVDRKTEEDLILSRDKAIRARVWDDIVEAHNNNTCIEGTIVRKVKGGLTVDIGGCQAFLPGSQVDVRPVRDLDRYIGETTEFEILKYDRKRNNVVISRKTILEREQEERKKEILATIEEGMVMDGVVKNITDYGLFVDLGGIDGLLHITDMSWGRIRHPSENFSRGDTITVKVLSFDPERERVSLGLKQLTENPWDSIVETYTVGSTVEGHVVSIMDYGVFVELEPGVEGLVHVSEMFWTKKIRHPSKIVSVGDEVQVQVLEVDPTNKRISLGLKQTMPNPWELIKEQYPEGSVITGKIKNITDFGVFVGIDEEIDGLVHVSDLSWKKRVRHPSELYKKGQEIEAMVLNIDVENGKFSLGVKQLEPNPWELLKEKYGVGGVITGVVTNVTDFGVFVEIEEDIEGLVHISEISKNRVKAAGDVLHEGDTVTAVIKSIDMENQKVALSIKDYEQSAEPSSQRQYVNNNEKVVSNLGDLLANIKM